MKQETNAESVLHVSAASLEPQEPLEPRDPVAHPRYPPRSAGAGQSRFVHVVMESEDEKQEA